MTRCPNANSNSVESLAAWHSLRVASQAVLSNWSSSLHGIGNLGWSKLWWELSEAPLWSWVRDPWWRRASTQTSGTTSNSAAPQASEQCRWGTRNPSCRWRSPCWRLWRCWRAARPLSTRPGCRTRSSSSWSGGSKIGFACLCFRGKLLLISEPSLTSNNLGKNSKFCLSLSLHI